MSVDNEFCADGSLPDAVWKKIEANLPCDKSIMVHIETDDEILDLPLRQYIEMRIGGLVSLRAFRGERQPSLLQIRNDRENILVKTEEFIAGTKKLYGKAFDFGARGDVRELLSRLEQFADEQRKAIAVKIKRGRPKDTIRQVVLMDVLEVYCQLGGKLSTTYRSHIREDGPTKREDGRAIRFLVPLAEAVLGEGISNSAARKFIRTNKRRIKRKAQLSP
jgi:hypothetical protein